jgi:hypothetical protein
MSGTRLSSMIRTEEHDRDLHRLCQANPDPGALALIRPPFRNSLVSPCGFTHRLRLAVQNISASDSSELRQGSLT